MTSRLPVCNISDASLKLCKRLADNPSGIPVSIGWNGDQIAVFSSTYKQPVKSLPHLKIRLMPGLQFEEVETMLMLAVATLRCQLPAALTKGAKRPATASHAWRSSSIARKVVGA